MGSRTQLAVEHVSWLQHPGRYCYSDSPTTKVIALDAAGGAFQLGVSAIAGIGCARETDMQRYRTDSRLLRANPVVNDMSRTVVALSLGLPRPLCDGR